MKLQILFDETLWGDLSNAYRLTCRPLMLVHEEERPKVTWGQKIVLIDGSIDGYIEIFKQLRRKE